MPEFKTAYNSVPDEGEDLDPTSITETAGYIPADRQIQNLLNAGIQLQASRADYYDDTTGMDDEDLHIVPGRRGDLDLAEATEIERSVTARLQQQERDKQQQDVERLAKEAEKAPEKNSPEAK